MNELFEMLGRMGIEPMGKNEPGHPRQRYTEHRIVEPAQSTPDHPEITEIAGIDLGTELDGAGSVVLSTATGIALGDKVVLLFSDDQKRISARLIEGTNDLEKGRLSITSPLGQAILGYEDGDEVELPLENGRQRKVLIESVEKSPDPVIAPPIIAVRTNGSAAVA